jgi:hypothetical protein
MRLFSRPWLEPAEVLSGERLQALADISVVPRHVRDFHQGVERHAPEMLVFDDYAELDQAAADRLSRARSWFVYTHELEPFLEHLWPRVEGRGHVLITHNSDGEVDPDSIAWLEDDDGRLARWYAQNVTVRHPKVVPLPIGIANEMWAHGRTRRLLRAIARNTGRPKTKLAFLHFNIETYPGRREIWQTLRGAFGGLPQEPVLGLRHKAYLEELARHRFCICPRGNGIDTHRVWECLYLEVVPILARSVHSEYWARSGLPVLLIDDWAEVTPECLESEIGRFDSMWTPDVRKRLTVSHYAALVEAAAQDEAAMRGDRSSEPAR